MAETLGALHDAELEKALSPKNFTTDGDCMFAKGARIGEYEVLSRLGNSGLGELYLVRKDISRKRFALKVIPPIISADPTFAARFNELRGKVQSRLHPHLVHIHKMDVYSDVFDYYYMVMEYIESPLGRPQTLQDILDEGGRMSEARILKIALQLCSALDYAHSCKEGAFTHSDLKPSNVLFDTASLSRLSDFDLVRLLGRSFVKGQIRHCVNKSTAEGWVESSERQETLKLPVQTNTDMTKAFVLLDSPEEARSIKHGLGISRLIKSDYVQDLLSRMKGVNASKPDGQAAKPPAERAVRRHATHGSPTGLNAINSILDTYDYMSPEQKASLEPSVQSNIYTMGLILYRMLTGRKMAGCWNLPSKFGSSPGWDPIVVKCLKMEQEDRYASVAELRSELLAVHAGRINVKHLLAAGFLIALAVLAGAYLLGHGFSSSRTGSLQNPEALASLEAQNQFPLVVKILPEGAKIQILKGGSLIDESASCPANGLQLQLARGLYDVRAAAAGRPPFRHEFEALPSLRELQLEIPKLGEPKIYPELASQPSPTPGFKWLIDDMKLEMLPISSCLARSASKTLARPFWCASCETSQWAYEKLMRDNPSQFRSGAAASVDRVSLSSAIEFCKRLSERERQAGRLPDGYLYRLPSEAEWEYCAKAGAAADSKFCFGNALAVLKQYAWFDGDSDNEAHPAATLKPNAWGLFDVHGNVWELCSDIIKSRNPIDPSQAAFTYLAKGGAYNSKPDDLTIKSRLTLKAVDKLEVTVGFRVILAPPLDSHIIDETAKATATGAKAR